MFGKYNNKKISKIKVFFIPLSLIAKIVLKPERTREKYQSELNQIPDIIYDRNEDISNFRIKIDGNINQNNIKVEMKSIL